MSQPQQEWTIRRHQVFPDNFPPAWASGWGEDEFGLWLSFSLKGVSQVFRWIEPGQFLMGSPEDETERSENETQHKVTLTQGFWLAETCVTQALWQVIMDENPSHFKGEDLPVENVSWKDIQDFFDKLTVYADIPVRLPTEAEWEYACRAGTQTPFFWGENTTPEQVNYNGKYPYADGEKGLDRGKTCGVKALPANHWGLYQMHGNVWEWCADWYEEYSSEDVENPRGPETGMLRVLRGGSWFYNGRHCRSAYRYDWLPELRGDGFGFRLALGHSTGGGA